MGPPRNRLQGPPLPYSQKSAFASKYMYMWPNSVRANRRKLSKTVMKTCNFMVFQTILAAEGGRENFTLGDPFVNFDPFWGGAPGTGAPPPPGYATD